MARQYKRDARGRFASGGSSGRRAGGTLAARASLRKSRQKLAAKDAADTSLKGTLSKRAQKAAVTKGSKKLREVKKASTVRLTKRGGTIGRPKGYVRPGERVARSLAAVKRSQKVKPNITKKQDSPARWAQQERRSSLNQSRGAVRADRVAATYLSAAETAAAFQRAGKKLPAHVAETLASSRREYKMGRKTESINRKAQLYYHSTFLKRFGNREDKKGYRPPNARRRR